MINILIVDDDEGSRLTIKHIVESSEYKARTATNGHEALKRVREKLPDIIILDLVMPEMDGYEVCRHLKADPLSARIPIIFLSGLISAEEKVKAFEAGGVDYIVKPCCRIELLARLRTHLTLQRTQNHLTAEVRQQTIELEKKNNELRETNITLKCLLHEIEKEKKKISQIMRLNIERLVLPHLERMINAPVEKRRQFGETIETTLLGLTRPLSGENTDIYLILTPAELRILNLIGQGRSSKSIAELLNVSLQTVAAHRKHIRKKLNISGKKINLVSFINGLDREPL